MDGILNLCKPSGPTSHDMVACVRRLARTRRVGHAGTLDPAAEGVLVLFLGIATRLIEFTADAEKEYVAQVALGVGTDTLDAQGQVVATADASALTRERLEAALAPFRGLIQQVPPMFSAVHHQGQRLYELARRGEEVEREARAVEIHELELLDFVAGAVAQARLRVACSKGTYIRTLAADLGSALGLPAHLASLVRTRVGPFRIENTVRLDDLPEGDPEAIARLLRPAASAVAHLPRVEVVGEVLARVRHGNAFAAESGPAGTVRIETPEGELIGVGDRQPAGPGWRVQPAKILTPASA